MNRKNIFLFAGILAMIGLVIGTFLQGGSLAQKILFLIGASALMLLAYVNRQKMFLVIEIVIVLSAVLAFWDTASLIKHLIFMGTSIIGVNYLVKINFSREDKHWPIGAFGLLLLAAGFATDAVVYSVLFNVFLGLGGILVAIYSGIGVFLYKNKIAWIWLILNIFFSVNPVITVVKIFG
jgi:hypothetical protein